MKHRWCKPSSSEAGEGLLGGIDGETTRKALLWLPLIPVPEFLFQLANQLGVKNFQLRLIACRVPFTARRSATRLEASIDDPLETLVQRTILLLALGGRP